MADPRVADMRPSETSHSRAWATATATYILVALGFLAIAAVAAWVPAKRAAALDPMNALRDC